MNRRTAGANDVGQAMASRAALSRGDRRGELQPGVEDYKRNIVRTLCACAAKSRNAALMLETWKRRSRLIVTNLRGHGEFKGSDPFVSNNN